MPNQEDKKICLNKSVFLLCGRNFRKLVKLQFKFKNIYESVLQFAKFYISSQCKTGMLTHTHTKRQANQHGWLPNLLGDGVKELKYSSVRCGKIYFVLGRQEQPRLNKNILYQHDEPTKDGPLSEPIGNGLLA
jgi:hypothetical protein